MAMNNNFEASSSKDIVRLLLLIKYQQWVWKCMLHPVLSLNIKASFNLFWNFNILELSSGLGSMSMHLWLSTNQQL